jgi:hypothetical protein
MEYYERLVFARIHKFVENVCGPERGPPDPPWPPQIRACVEIFHWVFNYQNFVIHKFQRNI